MYPSALSLWSTQNCFPSGIASSCFFGTQVEPDLCLFSDLFMLLVKKVIPGLMLL